MNETKATGLFDEAKGKVKQAVGDTFNDQSLANSGAVDEVKGHAEQTVGNVKDTAHDLTHNNDTYTKTEARHDAENTGHSLRDSITNAAEHMKDSISHGLDSLKHKTED